ncbi:hypothetical protein B0T17DRAFT_601254 [Bombardia bombarda]|uniref:Uncharacterized protein n=1 Tax=Bombardia bombarda TaxID=252184 RepID=A0AA39WMU7_9PEZI|nr:hypothetical protein B0T17DRAFT_601254 [Bombardia bombarda]
MLALLLADHSCGSLALSLSSHGQSEIQGQQQQQQQRLIGGAFHCVAQIVPSSPEKQAAGMYRGRGVQEPGQEGSRARNRQGQKREREHDGFGWTMRKNGTVRGPSRDSQVEGRNLEKAKAKAWLRRARTQQGRAGQGRAGAML